MLQTFPSLGSDRSFLSLFRGSPTRVVRSGQTTVRSKTEDFTLFQATPNLVHYTRSDTRKSRRKGHRNEFGKTSHTPMPETSVRVTLLEKSPHPTAMTATAARTCYSANDPAAIVQRWENKPDDMVKTVDRVRSAGHHSTLEHNIYVFGVTGLSRAATHQLVRHRIGERHRDVSESVRRGRPRCSSRCGSCTACNRGRW